ncbi:MAG TPA: hypothetical protein VNT79_09370 [Phycisphaerae bacterium]|nr:hypothetical protein [Phycisphaerae bacterium]
MATTTWQWRIASIERSRADDKAREAESSRAAAESSREAETTAKNAALRAKVEAERESYVANIVAAHASFVSNEASSIRARLDACSSQYRGWEWNYLNAQSDNCLFVIGDLKVRVRAAAFSPDGRQIVTGMSDGTARVWNATTGSELLVLRGHSDSIESVVFSADGKRIITTASDAAIAWDSVNGDEQLVIHSQGSIGTAEFSADGRHIVGQRSRADDLSEIVIWNAVTGDELAALDGLYKAVSPDGARLLTMDREAAQLWDMNGTELWRLEGGSLYEATFSADGEHLVIVTSGNPLIVDAATGKERALLSNGTLSVAISPDSRHLLTGKLDETATIWDMDGKELLSLHGHSHWVESGQFSPDGRKIVTASRDRTARVWDATDGRELAVLRGHREDLDLAVFSSNAARIMTLSRGDGTVRVWDGDTHEIRSNASNLMSAIFSPDGTRIVTASLDYPLEIWNAASGIKLGTLGSEEDGRSRELVAAGYHPDGTRIVTSAWDGAPRLWDATLGKELAEFPVRQASTPHSSVSNGVVAFSPDGDLFVATSIEQFPVRFELSVRDSVTGREVVALHEQEPGFLGAAFDPSGPRIVTASGDPTARTWNVETGDELMRLSGHEKGVSTCAYSLDGTRIVTASSDNTARVWHSESGNELLTLRGHQDRLQAVAFSPDGARIVTSAYDQTVRLWDAATGRELLTLRDNAEVVRTVAFSPDGTRIVTASQHGAVRVLDSVPYRQRFAELDTLYKARAPAERLLDLLMTGNSEPEEVVATIQRNPDLSEPVRRVALDMILERNLNFEDEARKRLSALYAAHGTQPRVTAAIERDDLMPPMMKSEIRRLMLVRPRSATGLNAWAWRLVADQAIATEKIGMALEAAEQAAHLSPEDPAIMNTLGVAFYRHGDYAEAIVELEKSERQFAFAKNSESPSTTPQHPANWAFIAMSHFQLGHADEARAALEKLRALMREEGHADDEESQQFLREAEALIEGRTTSSELLATSQPTTTNPATE